MLTLLLGCAPPSALGDFTVVVEDGSLTLSRGDRVLVSGLSFAVGEGDESIEWQSGSYRVESGSTSWTNAELGAPWGQEPVYQMALEVGSDQVGTVLASVVGTGVLQLTVAGDGNRIRWDAPCTGDDAFAGLGSHVDVDHVGEAFPLWVSEPGIGKVADDDPPDDWFLTGTRHAQSMPDPFLLRPEPYGLVLSGQSRIEVDLCTGDRWTLDSWSGAQSYLILAGDDPLEIVEAHARASGDPAIPPDWAFAPWNDAVGGVDRLAEVVAELRAADAPSSVIWTEDWKGGEATAYGYHLTADWTIDDALYPDASALDAGLEAQGFKWLAYFSPFLGEESDDWVEAEEYAIRDADGDPYLFTGITFSPTSVLDLTRDEARAWAIGRMETALDLGFDGWMTDFAEWLPPDAVLANADAVDDHNAYPLWWQATNAEALEGRDALMFTRSGWSGSNTLSPINWGGDQRTSFDADDGLPTVVPLGLGAGIAGAAVYTHDIAGYSSIGNDPSTKELWFRWCTLGAMTPVMRTHHGAFKDDNWQFDSDADTLAHFARWGRVHTQLFPYLRGLAALAQDTGRPMLLAPFLLHPEEPWGRSDAWFLGASLLVAPVVESGVSGREVDLPSGAWFDFWTGAPAASGWFEVPTTEIATFAPAGAVVPMFAEAPDTLVNGPLDGLDTLDEADTARVIRVFSGAPGTFIEADGTTYTASGSGSGVTSGTFAVGQLTLGGLTVEIEGTVERTYTVEAYE